MTNGGLSCYHHGPWPISIIFHLSNPLVSHWSLPLKTYPRMSSAVFSPVQHSPPTLPLWISRYTGVHYREQLFWRRDVSVFYIDVISKKCTFDLSKKMHPKKYIEENPVFILPFFCIYFVPYKSLDELFDAFFQREVLIPPWSVILHGSVVLPVRHILQRVLSDL